jgi:hypothetical protein
MKLELKRIAMRDDYTIGHLYVDGKYICDTLEDKVRDINHSGKFDNGEVKVAGQTAIPYGTYKVAMGVVSPKNAHKAMYAFCGGKLPRLIDVPDFAGVLIHIGNFPKDTEGCILVGQNKVKGQLINSTATFGKLYALMADAYHRREDITITIV